MYFTTFGGSALLHLLAGHPRLVALLGITAAVVALSSPLGPGTHLGSDQYASAIERQLLRTDTVSAAAVTDAEQKATQLIATQDPRVPTMIASALQACGTNCSNMGVASVMQNRTLAREVLMMYSLDRAKLPANRSVRNDRRPPAATR